MVVVMNFRDKRGTITALASPAPVKVIFNSDSTNYGDDYSNHPGYDINTDAIPYDGLGQSAEMALAPTAA